ncbi:biopolymer transporter ExbD [bacterium]|nr:biopolymer transporter ExbD [bacterium]HPF35538.1 biopolymer transporter ExbD [Candidatus Krumholzibacteria bacterium]HRX50114.1 biopolymer transporter ExbD [Candidatus Krumholzibacteria bacterium]
MDFAPPRGDRKVIINITSLIDVMFLLLIFFLVTSTFKEQPAIELDLPSSSTAETVDEGPAVLYLTADGATYLDDDRLSDEELRQALRQRLAATGDDRLILRADTDSRHGDVVKLYDLIRETGYRRLGVSARREDGGDAAP